MAAAPTSPARVQTGISGLDDILGGGLPQGRIYLVHGSPGAGKTTLAYQFLRQGALRGERVLFVTFLQSIEEIRAAVETHGWDLDEVSVLELPRDVQRTAATEQTLFHPADIELSEATESLLEAIETHRPQRLVLDSLSELSVLTESPYQLRRHLIRLKQHLAGRGCTTLMTAGDTGGEDLASIETMVHGVIELKQEAPPYGRVHRRVLVSKMRGVNFMSGYHDFRILTGGIEVFPRIRVFDAGGRASWETMASGNPDLDALLGGGMEEGSSCLLVGASGAGKSTLSSLYVQAAAERGQRSAVYCFDESRETFLRRSQGLGIDIAGSIERGLVDLRQIDVGETTAGEFAQLVCRAADEDGAKIVVIDSLTGYLNAMQEARQLEIHLHELLSYLSGRGVLVLLVVSVHGLVGSMEAAVDASYMADTVIVLRYFEAEGRIRKCISVLKKRHGSHDTAIKEIDFDRTGLRVGEPLSQFSGVMTGVPRYTGASETLLGRRETTS